MSARETWRQWYRAIRVARREQQKAWRDMMLYGTGIVMVPNDGSDPYRVRPEDFCTTELTQNHRKSRHV